jgi:acetyl-CoA synthetase
MSAIYNPSPAFVQNAHISGMAAYEALCKEAQTDYPGYWGRLAKEFITWKTPFTKVLLQLFGPQR